MTDREISLALMRMADIGIVHYSEAGILREAAERIELLYERVAIMGEVDGNVVDDAIGICTGSENSQAHCQPGGPDDEQRTGV